jgi:hypothetical protein
MKIKCVKILCLNCNKEGLGQVFLTKDNRISYCRVRHYKGLDKTTKKPLFKYCKVSDKSTLDNLAISLTQDFNKDVSKPMAPKFMVKASGSDLRPLDQKNKFIEQNSVNQALFSKLASGRSLVW